MRLVSLVSCSFGEAAAASTHPLVDVEALKEELAFRRQRELLRIAGAQLSDRVIFKSRLHFTLTELKTWQVELTENIKASENGRDAAMSTIEDCAAKMGKLTADRKNKRSRK